MSPTPADQCAFCKINGENSQTGELQRTPNGKIVAHYNCMLYSPRVTSKDSQEDIEGFDFKIDTVRKEIKRGKNLHCTFCKKSGATVGCDVKSCKRTYHYPCVEKAKGSPSKPNDYVVYCFEHKDENNSGHQHNSVVRGSPTSTCSNIRKRKRSSGKKTKNWKDWPGMDEGWKRRTVKRKSGGRPDIYYLSPEGIEFKSKNKIEEHFGKTFDPSLFGFKNRKKLPSEKKNLLQEDVRIESQLSSGNEAADLQNMQINEQPEANIILNMKSSVTDVEASEDALSSTSGQQPSMSSGTSSEESPKVTAVFSLRGFPKRKKKYRPDRSPSEELQKVLNSCSSQDKAVLSQIYSELGGSQQFLTLDTALPQDNQNELSAGNSMAEEDPEQDREDVSVTEEDPVCQETSKSITSNRKQSLDFTKPLPNINVQQTEANSPEVLEIPEEEDESNFRGNVMQRSVESELASDHQSESPRMIRSRRRRLHAVLRRRRICQFARLVAQQCCRMSHNRLIRYMLYVLASADLFCAPRTLPNIDILLATLQTVLDTSRQ